jgi:hypothetical protein
VVCTLVSYSTGMNCWGMFFIFFQGSFAAATWQLPLTSFSYVIATKVTSGCFIKEIKSKRLMHSTRIYDGDKVVFYTPTVGPAATPLQCDDIAPCDASHKSTSPPNCRGGRTDRITENQAE